MAKDLRIRTATAKNLSDVVRLWRELIGFHEALRGQDFRPAPGAEQEWKKYLRSHVRRPKKGAPSRRRVTPVWAFS